MHFAMQDKLLYRHNVVCTSEQEMVAGLLRSMRDDEGVEGVPCTEEMAKEDPARSVIANDGCLLPPRSSLCVCRLARDHVHTNSKYSVWIFET